MFTAAIVVGAVETALYAVLAYVGNPLAIYAALLLPIVGVVAICRTYVGLLAASALIGNPSWQFAVVAMLLGFVSGLVVAAFLGVNSASTLLVGVWFSAVHASSVVFYRLFLRARGVEPTVEEP